MINRCRLVSLTVLFQAVAILSIAQIDTLLINFTEPTGNIGDEICTDVSVRDFKDLVSFQLSIGFNPDVVAYERCINGNTENFGCSVVNHRPDDPGAARVLWSDALARPVTIADNSILFSLCFTLRACPADSDFVSVTPRPIKAELIYGDPADPLVSNVIGGIRQNPGKIKSTSNECAGGAQFESCDVTLESIFCFDEIRNVASRLNCGSTDNSNRTVDNISAGLITVQSNTLPYVQYDYTNSDGSKRVELDVFSCDSVFVDRLNQNISETVTTSSWSEGVFTQTTIETSMLWECRMGAPVCDFSSALAEIGLPPNVSIYPNPVVQNVTIDQRSNHIKAIQIINTNGQVLKQISEIESKQIIDLGSLQSGIFYILFEMDSEKNYLSKLYKM